MSVGVYQSAITDIYVLLHNKTLDTYVSLSKHTYSYFMITLAFIVHAYRAALDRCAAWVEIFCLWVLFRTSCYKRRVPSRGVSNAQLFNTLQEANRI